MKFVSLINIKSQTIVSIDATNLLLGLEIDDIVQDIRLKPYMGIILYALFTEHPKPLAYDKILRILQNQRLVIPDLTRMHRKVSEIRLFLNNFHPSLTNIILNMRGVGYTLPLYFKPLPQRIPNDLQKISVNIQVNKVMKIIHSLVEEAVEMTSSCRVIHHAQGYISQCDQQNKILIVKIALFDDCQTIILNNIGTHPADFNAIRITYFLAKLRTYIGLARISEYPITPAQWHDWFKQEIWLVYNELITLIKFTERC